MLFPICTDTPYWEAARENQTMSDSVAAILDVWDNGGDLLTEVGIRARHRHPRSERNARDEEHPENDPLHRPVAYFGSPARGSRR